VIKEMQKLKFLPLMVLLVLVVSPITLAYASYSISIPYSKFNSESITWYYVDKYYDGAKETFEVKITNQLTINTSQTNPAKLRLAPDDAGQGAYLDVQIYPDGMLKLYHPDGATEFYAQPNVWSSGVTLKIVFEPSDSLQKITIYKDGEKLASFLTDNIVSVKLVGAFGYPDVVTSGSLEFSIGESITFTPILDLLYAIIPLVVLIGVVRVVVNTIKKSQ